MHIGNLTMDGSLVIKGWICAGFVVRASGEIHVGKGIEQASVDAGAFLGYYGMRIHIPKMKYLSWSTPIGGPNRLQTSFTAKAEYDDVSGEMIAAELFNVVASYQP